jgi:hypothetical protein
MGYRSSTTKLTNASTTNIIDAPAGVVAGDLIIIAIAVGSSGTAYTPPSGFTDYGYNVLNSYDSALIGLMWKIAGLSEPSSYTITLGSAIDSAAVCTAVSGVTNPTTPIASASFQTADVSTLPITIPSASVSPSAAGSDLIWLAGFDTYVPAHSTVYTGPTSPAGFTLRASISGANSGATNAQNIGVATGTASDTSSTTISGGDITNPVGTGAQSFVWLLALNSGGPTGPALSSPTPSGTIGTSTTATLGATTTNGAAGSNNIYGVWSTSNGFSGVTATQVKAGQNAAGSTSGVSTSEAVAVTSTSPTISVSSLTANTLYYYALVQTDVNGDSNVVTGSFTTAAVTTSTALGLRNEFNAPINFTSFDWFLISTWGDTVLASGTTSTNGSGSLLLSGLSLAAGPYLLFYKLASNQDHNGMRPVTLV